MLEDKDLLSIQEVRTKVEEAYTAWLKYRDYSQERVDAVVERMAAAARANARLLAEMAVEETGYGNAADKYVKNLLAADVLPRRMRGMKTVGLLRELPEEKMVEYGVPMGVVAAILPTTNPTSTAIYKILIALKSGNAIVVSPHPRAHQCTCRTAALLSRAAVEADAPAGIIQCVDNATLEATNALMRHERTAVILSTGGAGIAPQGSTGITTNLFPSMTLGCGAVAGNSASDNVGPLHLINVKRLAYVTRKADEAFEPPVEDRAAGNDAPPGRQTVAAAVERYLASRGQPVGQALPPANKPADLVCEADVRAAIEEKRKIPIGPGTIVTPSARDLAGATDVLAPVKG
jgi:hypothetical protein